jgi:hypothetical protein
MYVEVVEGTTEARNRTEYRSTRKQFEWTPNCIPVETRRRKMDTPVEKAENRVGKTGNERGIT